MKEHHIVLSFILVSSDISANPLYASNLNIIKLRIDISSFIFNRLKNNAFIWRPEKTTRYLPHKLMTGMMLNPEYSNEVYLYDTKRFSARTYGTPIEYNVRNRSETFLAKRKCELENNVLSCTNSYIKMKLFMVKDKFGRKERKPLSEFDKKEVYKSNTVGCVLYSHEVQYI